MASATAAWRPAGRCHENPIGVQCIDAIAPHTVHMMFAPGIRAGLHLQEDSFDLMLTVWLGQQGAGCLAADCRMCLIKPGGQPGWRVEVFRTPGLLDDSIDRRNQVRGLGAGSSHREMVSVPLFIGRFFRLFLLGGAGVWQAFSTVPESPWLAAHWRPGAQRATRVQSPDVVGFW